MKLLQWIKECHKPRTLYTDDSKHYYPLHDFLRYSDIPIDDAVVDLVVEDGEGEVVFIKR